MLSKAQNKYIRSLSQHKFRMEFNAFIAEGDKIVREWLNSNAKIELIIALEDWAEKHIGLIEKHHEARLHIVSEKELQQVSGLQTPNRVLLVVPVPEPAKLPYDSWCIALDNIQDPGNLGTIIRIADWFGISHIVCSPDCVDFYNPKVVQSAMGGHLRVALHEADLNNYLSQVKMPIIAAVLGGMEIKSLPHLEKAVIMIGNESRGLSEEMLRMATYKITIPGKGGAESLNAAVSAGIICAMLMQS